MPDRSFNVKNGLVVNTNLLWANSGKVGINNSAPDASLTVTGTANLNGNVYVTGNLEFSGKLFGTNVAVDTINLGSTFINATVFNIGSNVDLTVAALKIGNSTINTVITATSLVTGSASVNAVINSSTIAVGAADINSTGVFIGANVDISTSSLKIGNATANIAVNSTSYSLDGDALVTSPAFQALTPAATINWDMSQGYNAILSIDRNSTLAKPTNFITGATYALRIFQANGGGHTLAYSSSGVDFDFGSAGNPTLSTGDGKNDFIFLFAYAANSTFVRFRCTFSKDA